MDAKDLRVAGVDYDARYIKAAERRVAKDTKKRVVGVLLGTRSRGSVDVTNSFAVPFEEDAKSEVVTLANPFLLKRVRKCYDFTFGIVFKSSRGDSLVSLQIKKKFS